MESAERTVGEDQFHVEVKAAGEFIHRIDESGPAICGSKELSGSYSWGSVNCPRCLELKP